ncbi:hypothetical protein [Pseudomonas mediterranea]
MSEEFKREERYLVVKISKLADDKGDNMSRSEQIFRIAHFGKALVNAVVVEEDWPEYEPVWQMIDRRMGGKPAVTAAEELAAVLHWRGKHDQAIKERDALQLRLNAADQLNDELVRDKARLDALESNFWDVRFDSSPNGDAGDSSTSIEIVGHWMDKPFERVIGENYSENLRAAIDQAMTAPTYPPARPEYPEPEEAKDEDWRMHPCTQGHRDVGAAGGVAHCYTCDEKIEAATTQEAFERWNATHPAEQPAPVAVVTPQDEKLMEIVERYPNGDPLEYDAALRQFKQ